MSELNLRMPLTIHLVGRAVQRHRLPLDQLTWLATHLQVAIHRIGRILSGESFSLMPGRLPKEVKDACSLEVVAIRPGSLSIVCDLPSEIETPTQLSLFKAEQVPDLGEQSLEALVQGIAVIGQANGNLPRGFDKGALLALREGGKIFSLGIDAIEFELESRRAGRITSSYTPAVHERVIARIQEPVINKATIEGRLLMGDFRESSYCCRVHPAVGRPIRCTFEEEQREAVLAALTRYVRLVGETIEIENEIKGFKIQDIEILDTEQFAGGQEFHPFFDSHIDLDALAAEQGVPASTPFEDLLGDFWPEDESLDEFIEAVRSWRREGLPDAS